MLCKKSWVKVGLSLAFTAALTCCTVLSFEVLCNEHDMKAGIITFTFKLTDAPVPLFAKNLIPPVVSAASDIASNAATVGSVAASQMNSVASAATTAVNGPSTMIPRNLSVGTKQYCLGFSDHIECNRLPVNASGIFTQALTNSLSGQIEDRLHSVLEKANPGWIRDPFIIGIATALVTALIFFCSLFSWPFGSIIFLQDLKLLMMPRLVIGLVCCLSYLLPTVVIYLLFSKSTGLPSEIEADQGTVGGYCWGTLFSALFMTSLTTFIHNFV